MLVGYQPVVLLVHNTFRTLMMGTLFLSASQIATGTRSHLII
jgi:hypothetical protein